jgi:aryl-alcohol dehydrogenase-like predicted oxidoreductase
MRYVTLGSTGLRVSELCLGTMTFGDTERGADSEATRAILDRFAAAGGTFLDTANHYNHGESERLVGAFIQSDRDRFVVASKYTLTMQGDDPNASGNQRKNMMRSVEASLRRLGTEYIDVYWVHAWDFLTPVDEIMRGLDDLVRQGKIHYAAVSDAPAWAVAQANTLASLRGWTPFSAIQIEYSLVERTPDRELLPMARAFGLEVLAWSPLGAGVLTGKYLDEEPEEGRLRQGSGRLSERNQRLARAAVEIAGELGCSASQVALAWVRHRGAMPIMGVRTVEQLEDNLGCLDVQLQPAHLARLDEESRIEPGFPHDLLSREAVRWRVYGDAHAQLRPDF